MSKIGNSYIINNNAVLVIGYKDDRLARLYYICNMQDRKISNLSSICFDYYNKCKDLVLELPYDKAREFECRDLILQENNKLGNIDREKIEKWYLKSRMIDKTLMPIREKQYYVELKEKKAKEIVDIADIKIGQVFKRVNGERYYVYLGNNSYFSITRDNFQYLGLNIPNQNTICVTFLKFYHIPITIIRLKKPNFVRTQYTCNVEELLDRVGK